MVKLITKDLIALLDKATQRYLRGLQLMKYSLKSNWKNFKVYFSLKIHISVRYFSRIFDDSKFLSFTTNYKIV